MEPNETPEKTPHPREIPARAPAKAQHKRAHRRAHGGDHGSELPHIDEKWLMSYSDMMTLLFGLFVMLYSMAMEKQGHIDETLKSVSENIASTNGRGAASVGASTNDKQTRAPAEIRVESQAQPQIESKTEADELKAHVRTLEAKLVKAQNKLKEQSKPNPLAEAIAKNRWSALVIVSWNNEKHDIDLEVRSPKGNWFNFKNPRIDGDENEFVQDSSKGPGTEIFKAAANDPGEHEIKVRLYNYRGDTSDSKVDVKVSLPTGQKKIKTVIINPEHREEIVKVDLRRLVYEK